MMARFSTSWELDYHCSYCGSDCKQTNAANALKLTERYFCWPVLRTLTLMFNLREKILQAYTHAEKATVKKERHSPFLKNSVPELTGTNCQAFEGHRQACWPAHIRILGWMKELQPLWVFSYFFRSLFHTLSSRRPRTQTETSRSYGTSQTPEPREEALLFTGEIT